MRVHSERPKPLYRKVNTRTWGVRHGSGTAAKYERGTKDGPKSSMHSGQKHGLDYTPLFKFLQSRVGRVWDEVYAELKGRVLSDDPIFDMVALDENDGEDIIRMGESSYFYGLFVDDAGLLQRVNPDLTLGNLHPSCSCCTHTFNGDRFTHAWDGNPEMVRDT